MLTTMPLRRLRHALKGALSPVLLPIRGGPLKGLRWSAASGIRFLRGDFEEYKTAALMEAVQPGAVVYDVGAHVGYYTALAARRCAPDGVVFAFEPRKLNLLLLRRHLRANRLINVRVIAAAVGAATGRARFDTRTGTGTGRVSESGDAAVDIVALDEWAEQAAAPAPHVLKVDVEGGELEVLEGAAGLIGRARPVILLATHGDAVHQRCLAWLAERGYTVRELERTGPSGDTELLALPGA